MELKGLTTLNSMLKFKLVTEMNLFAKTAVNDGIKLQLFLALKYLFEVRQELNNRKFQDK